MHKLTSFLKDICSNPGFPIQSKGSLHRYRNTDNIPGCSSFRTISKEMGHSFLYSGAMLAMRIIGESSSGSVDISKKATLDK
ncbi:hypothetical protein RchiOBHm_Chr6g0271141 [Rosa chinensis]|uniref:Uncharacterized protein n=1 Tax=Rosa chinensis TaxID=74649 RepID=A0A2P6PQV5_ROSCH|nr:hypothetical protein RchiOBHm_Chr6g0271141 [Rosa chinensis]